MIFESIGEQMKTVIFTLLFISLSACTPNTAGGVRSSQSSKIITFLFDENYQPVYRKILEQSRKCNETGMITAQLLVKNDLYTDIKQGTISVELHGALGVNVYQVIDVKYLEENKTEVKVYYAMASHSRHANTIPKWVTENYKECS